MLHADKEMVKRTIRATTRRSERVNRRDENREKGLKRKQEAGKSTRGGKAGKVNEKR